MIFFLLDRRFLRRAICGILNLLLGRTFTALNWTILGVADKKRFSVKAVAEDLVRYFAIQLGLFHHILLLSHYLKILGPQSLSFKAIATFFRMDEHSLWRRFSFK